MEPSFEKKMHESSIQVRSASQKSLQPYEKKRSKKYEKSQKLEKNEEK